MSRIDGPVVSARGVVRIYPSSTGPVHALRDVDVAFYPGRLNVVAGPSGSGKSSLLRILGAVDRPSAGTVEVAGRRTEHLSHRHLRRLRRSAVAFVLQDPAHNLIDQLSVSQHLVHAARVAGVTLRDVHDLVDGLGLSELLERRPDQLSGGEQQRVAVAMAAVAGRRVLVADEPTAQLDRASAQNVVDALCAAADRGACLVVSSHDTAVIAAADTTVTMRHGAVLSEGRDGRTLAVIDGSGRIQLPPEVLERFPERRAALRVETDHVRLDPS